jgi:hypothetical protein
LAVVLLVLVKERVLVVLLLAMWYIHELGTAEIVGEELEGKRVLLALFHFGLFLALGVVLRLIHLLVFAPHLLSLKLCLLLFLSVPILGIGLWKRDRVCP